MGSGDARPSELHPYTGFPRVLHAIFVARRVFEERDVSPLTDEGSRPLGASREHGYFRLAETT